MYLLTVITLGGAQITFQYQGSSPCAGMKPLDDAFTDGTPEMVNIADDYGRRAAFRLDEIAGYSGMDVDEANRGNGDARILSAISEADLQRRAQSEPKLKVLSMQAPGLLRQ